MDYPTTRPDTGTYPRSINAYEMEIIAADMQFNVKTITVRPGAKVTVIFINQDEGVPHNFAVYTDDTAQTRIFSGKIVTGPDTITYNFPAPSEPGTYFFRCDVHPQMNGQFIIDEGAPR